LGKKEHVHAPHYTATLTADMEA